jgi:nitrite reductase/ring-hydroxylating ferredoxin subunit
MPAHRIGPASDLPPGTHRLVKIRNIDIGVFNVDGAYYALPNICPHQYGPISTGSVGGMMACSAATDWKHAYIREGEILTCPWHGYEFDITSGRCLSSPHLRVRQYPVTVEDGDIWVTL